METNVNREKSLKLNFIMNALLTVSTFIFPLISFPYISRVLLPEGVGKVNFAVSFVAYFNMFAQLGIPTYGIKACAKVRNDKEKLSRTVHELLFINIICSLISLAILMAAIFCIPRLSADYALYLIVSTSIIFSSIGMEWLYQAVEEYSYITIRSVVCKLISIAAMFLLVKDSGDYRVYAAILIFASGASNILNLINSGKLITWKYLGNYNISQHFKAVLVFFALACTTTVYTNLDNVMLGFMKSDAEVGYYSTAVKIKTVLVSVVTSLGAVLLPRASFYVEKGRLEEFKEITKKAVHFVVLAATPLAVYFMIYTSEAIRFIAGDAYANSVLPMQIIMPTLILVGLSNVIGMEIMVPLGKERTVLQSTIIGAAVDLILNALLIPKFGASGAAVGTLTAEIAVTSYQMLSLKSETAELFGFKKYKIVIALVVASFVSIVVRGNDYGAFKDILYSSILFFGTYAVTLYFLKEELVRSFIDEIAALPIFKEENLRQFFLVCYGIAIASMILPETYIFPRNLVFDRIFLFVKVLTYIGAALLVCLNYIKGKYSKKSIIIILTITIILGFVAFKVHDFNLIVTWIFMLAAIDTELVDICKYGTIVRLSIVIITVALSLLGLITNSTILRGNGIVREYLGFSWTTTAPNLLFYSTLTLLYWRKDKLGIIESFLIAGFATLLYVHTNTKSAYVFTLLALIIALMIKYVPQLKGYKDIYGIINIMEIPICAFSIIAVSCFGDVNTGWIAKLDNILTGRITLGQKAFEEYGIRLFGNNITWVGGEGIVNSKGEHIYNFVDSSFLQILLNLGIIVFVLIMIYYMMLAIKGLKKKDKYLAVVLLILIAHTTFDPQLIMMDINSFILGLSYIGLGII